MRARIQLATAESPSLALGLLAGRGGQTADLRSRSFWFDPPRALEQRAAVDSLGCGRKDTWPDQKRHSGRLALFGLLLGVTNGSRHHYRLWMLQCLQTYRACGRGAGRWGAGEPPGPAFRAFRQVAPGMADIGLQRRVLLLVSGSLPAEAPSSAASSSCGLLPTTRADVIRRAGGVHPDPEFGRGRTLGGQPEPASQ